jgi:Phytanoyl-CoA dioxygenase (PhyH)
MKQIIRNLVKSGRKTELLWRYGFNLMPTVNYKISSGNKLNKEEAQILQNLNSDGLAISSVESLFPNDDIFQQLEKKTSNLLDNWDDRLDLLKKSANDESSVGKKTYSIELLGSKVEFDFQNAFTKLALHETLLNIANAYLGMYAKLRYYNLWFTFPTKTSARESQLWHFDREDNYILKVFVYLKDVDEGAGPFTYAPGTHRKGKFNSINPKNFNEEGVLRTTDEQMNEVFPEKNWFKAIGKKGSIIFADTRGFHKGGEARENERLVFTSMYTSPASDSKRLITYPQDFNQNEVSESQFKALQLL